MENAKLKLNFDFDTPVERRGTASVKWDRYAGRDILPLWVADMDFPTASPILEALYERVDHGVFGYGNPPDSLADAVVAAMKRDYNWRIHRHHIVWLPGLVTGLNVACRAVGEPGDGVFTASPIYQPFFSAPRFADRELVSARMVLEGGRWQWDFGATEAAITPHTRTFLLCNPHNPTGRVFTREELLEVAHIAERRDLVIVSDEIHCGLVLDPACHHQPLASLDKAIAARTITLMAPSKTWNIPGLGCSFAVIADEELRSRFLAAMRGIVPHPNVMGYVATEAAYRDGEPWRRALVRYLRGNAARVLEAVAEMPGLSMAPVEATSLAWIDARELGLEKPVAYFETAGVGLSDGAEFGSPGFLRLNFGCPRATLDEALRRMSEALRSGGM
jgi:cystathionine beta-lyase